LPVKIHIDESGVYDGNVASFELDCVGGRHYSIAGESVGGGKINIFELEGTRVDLDGEYPTLITAHEDKAGMLAEITRVLADSAINIAFLKLYREEKHEKAVLVAQTDEALSEEGLLTIREIDGVWDAISLKPLP